MAAISVAAAVIAACVFIGSLAYFFGQDDFLGLARARGFAPPLMPPWRWLSGQAYFQLLRPFGIASALPYRLVSLLAHAGCAALLARLLSRRFTLPAALVGAAFFAAHASNYTAVYSVSGIGEILSLLFSLAAIDLAWENGPVRWTALLLFLAALMCKESVLLLPLALAIPGGWLAPGARDAKTPAPPLPRPLAISLTAVALAFAAVLFTTDVFGVRSGLGSSAPYAVSWGAHIGANLASYAGWAVNAWYLTTRGFQDAVDPGQVPAAVLLAIAFAAGCCWAPLRRRGWIAGGAAFLLLLMPVLALPNHTYHYYLVAPLAGAAWCLVALFDAVVEATVRSRPVARKLGWALGSLLALAFAINGWMLVHKIETFPFTDPRLRADPVVDRARIARRVYDDLRAAGVPPGVPLVFWSPASLQYRAVNQPGTDPALETYWESNVRSALMNGVAIRVLFPQVGEVRFVHMYQRVPPPTEYVLYDPDGGLRVERASKVDSAMIDLQNHPRR